MYKAIEAINDSLLNIVKNLNLCIKFSGVAINGYVLYIYLVNSQYQE